VELALTSRADYDALLAVHRVRRGRCIDASPCEERPQDLAGLGIVGPEPTVAFAGEHEPARGRERAAHHRQRRLDLPGDLAGVVADAGGVLPCGALSRLC